jgi:hypothetical protein
MKLDLEVWLRGNDFAITDTVDVPVGEPAGWTDHEVRLVLEALLRAIDRAKNPDAAADRPVALRGFSWIVSPFEKSGVLLQVEIQLGAAAAGPFSLPEAELSSMVSRVIAHARENVPPAPSAPVH